MKQAIIKNILFVFMITNLMGSTTHAAVGDWIARKKQQSKAYVIRKINEAELKTQELLASLRANTSCLVRGDCPVEKKKRLRVIAGAITVAVAAIVAVAVFSQVTKEEKVKAASITEFLPDYVPDDSEQGMFMKAVHVGMPTVAKQYADLVQKHVLDAGAKLSARMRTIYPDQKGYAEIQSYLKQAQSRFNALLQRANELLLNAIRKEDKELVAQAYCSSPTPSRNAIVVGLEILRDRGRRYAQEVYDAKIVPIINFLSNPWCVR